jgi:3-phenylpropionate/trans-cinnamate dioxygenase ferredoxin subunit
MSAVSAAGFVRTVAVGEVAEGKALSFRLGDRPILICRSKGAFFAVENKCSHADEPLECGRIRNGWISCPAHGARFDLETGEALNPPAKDPIVTFALRIVDDFIEVAG